MLGTKLVRLIESRSEFLSRGLIQVICNSERTSDFRKIPEDELQLAAAEVYRHLGEWLLQKTEHEVARRFQAIGARRACEGIRVEQMVWALILSRDHLWLFLRREAFADTIVELHSELEMHQLLCHFFDRAIYYAILGHAEAQNQSNIKGDLTRAREFAIAIGLMSPTKTLEG